MFNDELSIEQCKTLLSRLAECAFPFQCAHGRPSMIPLLDLDSLVQETRAKVKEEIRDQAHFSAALKSWKYELGYCSGSR
jgi:DNA mismatch repair protein MLH3